MPDEIVVLDDAEQEVEAEEVEVEEVVPSSLTSTPMDFFRTILMEEWKTLDENGQREFREKFADFYKAASTLREKYDQTVWDGNDDGTVPLTVKSIRARRTGETGGAKPKVKTAAELLLKK